MARTFQGDASFTLHDKLTPHRFEVSVTDEHKIILWIEDRQSKKQWQTDGLDKKDFVTDDNAIPKATIQDYAERFAACLASTQAGDKYKRTLTTKGIERVLVITLPFQWASKDLALEYKFTMKEVPLARIDILGARVRDVEDQISTFADDRIRHLEQENATLKKQTKLLTQQVDDLRHQSNRTPVYTQATTTAQHRANQKLVWVAGEGDAEGVIAFLPKGRIQFQQAGVFAIDLGVIHSSDTNSVVFELKDSDTTLVSCHGSSYSGFYTTTPLHYIFKAKAYDEIHVVYKASNYTYPGSYIAITKL